MPAHEPSRLPLKPKRLTKARYYSSVVLLYGITLLVAWLLSPFYPQSATPIYANPLPVAAETESTPEPPPVRQIISGKPVRLVIAAARVDLPVQEGHYNPADQSWSLSGTRVNFAVPSALPNDAGGNTFIYGHNYPYVLGRLPQLKVGDIAQVFTDNGYVFTYTYQTRQSFKPNDASVFRYQGPPILSVQTCDGRWNQLREIFSFSFTKVEPHGG